VAEDRTIDDAEAASPIEPATAGAFMGEGGWQSQPRQASKAPLRRPNCHIRGPV